MYVTVLIGSVDHIIGSVGCLIARLAIDIAGRLLQTISVHTAPEDFVRMSPYMGQLP